MSTISDGSEVQLSTTLKETLFRPFCYCVTIHHQQIAVDTAHAMRILVGGNHVSTLPAILILATSMMLCRGNTFSHSLRESVPETVVQNLRRL